LDAAHPNIAAWLDRIKGAAALAPSYDLMPGHPSPDHAAQAKQRPTRPSRITKRNGIGHRRAQSSRRAQRVQRNAHRGAHGRSAALGADADVRRRRPDGSGPSFCAGADLNWMKKMAGYSRKENVADAAASRRCCAP
jgi:hypothetical protein